MSEEMAKRYSVRIKGRSPMKMSAFSGQQKMPENITPEEEAERRAYRLPNKNLGFPSKWLYGALVNAAAGIAPAKQKTKDLEYVARRIKVEPVMGDLGVAGYAVDTVVVTNHPTPNKSTTDFVSKPRLDSWDVVMTVISTLPKAKIQALLEYAGSDVGVGSDTKHGYGQFEVTSLKEITR